MGDKVIRKLFGERKLTGADAGVLSSLTALGPWGIALIAAYLVGQGLVQLAEKIQAMRGPTAPVIPLTTEEETQIRDAVQAMEAERFALAQPESVEWIKEHPPEAILKMKKYIDWADSVAREIDANITSFPPGDPNRCKVLENAYHTIQGVLGILHYDSLTEYDEWQRSVDYWENKRKEIEEESRRSGCDYQRFEASPFGKGYLQW